MCDSRNAVVKYIFLEVHLYELLQYIFYNNITVMHVNVLDYNKYLSLNRDIDILFVSLLRKITSSENQTLAIGNSCVDLSSYLRIWKTSDCTSATLYS